MSEPDDEMPELAPVEVGDVLDLHTFRPRDVPELVRDYVDECVARGYAEVRIIHGKGIGNLRRTVHAALERHPAVVEYRLAGEGGGGWGATVATLRTG
jgi:dsDNA-specific endonuclease/ATPase MutS2